MGLINSGKIHFKFCQIPNIGKKKGHTTFDQHKTI